MAEPARGRPRRKNVAEFNPREPLSFDLVLTDTKQRPPSTEKRLRVADVRVKCQKNAPGITIDPVDKAPQSRRSGAGVEASIDASTVALQRPKTGA